MSPLTCKPTELVAGYAVKERIGVGGYGEVWKAEAPGGLTKAIKFIYGCHDDRRAVDELKALSRVKEVRHPFLLSLERIEVVDGQLIIVTELADLSLKDRYDQCRQENLPGVPRHELLVYLRDAADALDYMSEHHSLQHMDIKPENLLIVGGRVKVADFGLVKDVQNTTVSLMGGLTPIYAPPEVFDGRPSLHSDQYSLAIVYQEMLTGELPFPGKTAPQLVTQHMHDVPRLDSLPACEQATIARALAKDPEQRFASCREMIEALLEVQMLEAQTSKAQAESAGPATASRPSVEAATVPPLSIETSFPPQPQQGAAECSGDGRAAAVKTMVFEAPWGKDPAPAAQSQAEPQLPPLDEPAPVQTLPPIEISPGRLALRPTLVVGIGGMGARTLRRLTRRLRDRFADPAEVPVLRTLLVDTDAKALARATEGNHGTALDPDDTLAVPLRRREDYRSDSDQFLQWLSRRWLYNIPRSLQTEGLRPLGRLALVDHAETVFQRLHAAVTAITAPEAMQLSRQTTGIQIDGENPQVFVVASISGGTGSGTVLDVAYAARMVLAGLGAAGKDVCGVLTHSTGRNSDAKDLAIANAYACLSEMHHYSLVGRQPGHAAAAAPGCDENLGAFDDAYLIHLGDNLNEADLDAASDAVAEYLYLNAVTASGAFFDECRRSTRAGAASGHGQLGLRTFGLCQIGCSQSSVPDTVARLLCKQVVGRWYGREDEPAEPSPRKSPSASAADGPENAQLETLQLETLPSDSLPLETLPSDSLHLDLDRFITEVCEQAWAETGEDLEAYLRSALEEDYPGRQPDDAEGASPVSHFFAAMNALLGTRGENDSLQAKPDGLLHEALRARLKPLADRHGEAICDWILDRADRSGVSVRQTRRATDWAQRRLAELTAEGSVMLQRMQVPLVQEEHVILSTTYQDNGQPRGWLGIGRARKRSQELDPHWVKYFQLRLDQAILHRTCKLLQAVRARIAPIDDQLKRLGQELNSLADEFASPAAEGRIHDGGGDSSGTLNELYRSVADALHDRIPELAVELDQQLQKEFFAKHGGLRGVLEKEVDLRGPFSEVLRGAARTAVLGALNRMNVAELLLASGNGSAEPGHPLRAVMEAATPPLLRCGGSQRLLLVCPEGSDDKALQEAFRDHLQQKPSVVHDCDGDLVLCYEAERLPLEAVAARLIRNRPDYARAASRLHTRIDVKWSPLLPIE